MTALQLMELLNKVKAQFKYKRRGYIPLLFFVIKKYNSELHLDCGIELQLLAPMDLEKYPLSLWVICKPLETKPSTQQPISKCESGHKCIFAISQDKKL